MSDLRIGKLHQLIADRAQEIGAAIAASALARCDRHNGELRLTQDALASLCAFAVARAGQALSIAVASTYAPEIDRGRAWDRLALCPDHRDKATGRCIVCDAENRERREVRRELTALQTMRIDILSAVAASGICQECDAVREVAEKGGRP